jgi:hypothetical protein
MTTHTSLNRARQSALSLVLAAGLILAVVPAASAKTKLKISPTSPIVDDAVTVSWRTDRVLKPGYHYQVALVTSPGDDCSSLVYKDSRRRPGKGKPMSMRLSPLNDVINGAFEWCQGKASVMVSTVRDDASENDQGSIIGITEIRFKAKP